MKNFSTQAICAASLLLSVSGIYKSGKAADVVNQVTPGEFIVDHPTLINLGFEWLIQDDDNRNAQVNFFSASAARRRGGPDCRSCVYRASAFIKVRASSTSSPPTCSPGAFWTWSPTRSTKRGL